MVRFLIISILLVNNIYCLNLTIHDSDNPSVSHILDTKIINNDNIINVLNGINLINYVLEIIIPDECKYLISDVNYNSNLDILDVVLMVNLILGGRE